MDQYCVDPTSHVAYFGIFSTSGLQAASRRVRYLIVCQSVAMQSAERARPVLEGSRSSTSPFVICGVTDPRRSCESSEYASADCFLGVSSNRSSQY